MADNPILKEAVPAAPRTGKMLFAMAAPPCTLIIASSTDTNGEMLRILAFTTPVIGWQT